MTLTVVVETSDCSFLWLSGRAHGTVLLDCDNCGRSNTGSEKPLANDLTSVRFRSFTQLPPSCSTTARGLYRHKLQVSRGDPVACQLNTSSSREQQSVLDCGPICRRGVRPMRRIQGRFTESRRACQKTLTYAVLITVGTLLRTNGAWALQSHRYQEVAQEGWRLARATFDDPTHTFVQNFTTK